jgi:hypothetical protein
VSSNGRQAEILSTVRRSPRPVGSSHFSRQIGRSAAQHAEFSSIYLRYRRAGVTRLMSVGIDGRPMALGFENETTISSGGRFVAFTGDSQA